MLVDNLIVKSILLVWKCKDLNFDLAYYATTKIKVYKKVKQRFVMILIFKK